jgi:alkylation response protein AidB-like acyl-CoA dehydrogenase
VGQVLPWFCVGTAAMSNGLCVAALEATARHLQQAGFAQTGTHLRDLPNLRTPVERIFRDARAGWVMAPTADHLQDFIGRLLTGLPLL